jgi:uncharacterized protein (TIGR03437 family)
VPLFRTFLFLLFSAGTLAAQPVTFSDGNFHNGDWGALKIQDTTPGATATFTAQQSGEGGNPGAYRRVTHSYAAGTVTIAHLRAGALYEPRVHGGVSAIDYSYDLLGQTSLGMAYYLLVFQEGSYYRLREPDNIGQSVWRRVNRLGLAAGDFVKVAGPGPDRPNFAASAPPLQAGFATSNSAGPVDSNPQFRESGIDNWSVTIYSTPGSVTYADATYLNSDWTAELVPGLSSPGAAFSAEQELSDGNPGAYRRVRHNWGPGSIYVSHLRPGAVYDPLIRGPIAAVDYSYDLRLRNATPEQSVGYYLLLLQAGTYYRSATADFIATNSWQRFTRTRLTAADFLRISGGGPINPRFDALAPAMQLGLISFNEGAGGSTVRESGFDNWSVTVFAVPDLVLSPSSLAFTHSTGGPAPATQNLRILSSGLPIGFTAASPEAPWLGLSGLSGTTPATLSVSVNPAGLAPGNYLATLSVSGSPSLNSPQTVSVSLLVTQASAVLHGIFPDSIAAGSGSASLTVTGSGFAAGSTVLVNGTPVPTTVLSSTSLAAVIPGSFLASTGTLQITVSGASGATLFRVLPAGPVVTVTGVFSAASLQPGPVSPGQIVSIFGSRLGPETPVGLLLEPPGRVATAIGGVRALFDGIPGPLTYVQAGQVNAIVPYAVANRPVTQFQIEYLGTRSEPVLLTVAPSAPGIFTFSFGAGQGAILNQDFTINSASNPAERDSIVQIFATGEGLTNPPGIDGQIAADIYPAPILPVSVFIGGLPAQVVYAGAAPGLVAGVLQVNARIPAGAAAGPAAPIVIFVGSARSQPGVTLAIR